jgi:signal transduction histidine kinase
MTIAIPAAHVNSTDVIRHIINMIVSEIPADAVCVCNYHHEPGTFELMAHVADPLVPFNMEQMQSVIRKHIQDANSDTLLLSGDDLVDTPFQSALVFRLLMYDQLIGLLVLFSAEAGAFAPASVTRIAVPVNMIHMAIENAHLYDALARQMILAEAILETSRALSRDPSPQNIVEVLSDYLFDAHVTGCSILLYGPVIEDRPNGPFEYLEVAGSWSKRPEAQIPRGTKLYLSDSSPDFVTRLHRGESLVFKRAEELWQHLDPFVRPLVKASGASSVTLQPLRSGERMLGMVAIGTDGSFEFTQLELDTYRAVTEFLAINTMSEVLRQQHDRVTRGRAALLDAVTDGVVMILPDGISGRVLTVNQRFCDMFGMDGKTSEGMLLEELLAKMLIPENVRRELGRKWFSITPRDPERQEGDFHMVHSDGYPLDITWYSAPVYHQDRQVMGRIYTFHDVTAERMAVRVRSAFLSRVSHELRTPLTSIQGFAEFILEANGDQLPPLAREYTEIILSSARHLRAMFGDMIDMTRADAGELKLNMKNTHLPDVLIETIARLEPQYKKRKQSIVLDIDDNLPPVYIDPDRIMQVLTNIVMNAIKYSPESGKVRISTKHISDTSQLPTGAPTDMTIPAVLVTVIDQGQGLSAEDIEQVFLPFFRTEWARTNKVEGTGLGLAVARSIVELHRGRIWAEESTSKDPGGRFLFTIPITINI